MFRPPLLALALLLLAPVAMAALPIGFDDAQQTRAPGPATARPARAPATASPCASAPKSRSRGRRVKLMLVTAPLSTEMVDQRYASVPEYIASFPADVQPTLKSVRRAIRAAAPDAEELISYHIPTYKGPGWVLYFAGYKKHVSLHGSVEDARKAMRDELAPYVASGRGTIQFPLDEKLPVDLIGRIAAHAAGLNAPRARSARAPRPRSGRTRAG